LRGGVSVTQLARNGCREVGVARWPLTGSRAVPTFEDEASPATRFRMSCFGELRREGWGGLLMGGGWLWGGNDKVLLKKKKGGVSCAMAMARAGM
jgi:hypothetical protein